jgi:acetoacetyl-CoA synthetase
VNDGPSRIELRQEGSLLWTPPDELLREANITRYLRWLDDRGLSFETYEDLWTWSVRDLEAFWLSVWDFFEVKAHTPFTSVLRDRSMPGTVWFEGARLNYAEHALADADDRPAIVSCREDGPAEELTRADVARLVGAAASGLRRLGVRNGDRVAAMLPNGLEAVVAFLATASIGAIWSACSPEFGPGAIVDRFRQIEPKVLIAADGYQYAGRAFDRTAALAEIVRELVELEHVVLVSYFHGAPKSLPDAVPWDELIADPESASFEPVGFDHPLWILYSSGTTGLPKAMVQGHGGILLEHLKSLSLHLDLRPADRFFWFTTTGWMMWNFLVSGLLVGSSLVLYDGSPTHPDLGALWRLAAELEITYFGTSAPYIHACLRKGVEPSSEGDLRPLRSLGSTGAPLSPEGFAWVYEHVRGDVWLGSVSGGSDLCTPFVGSCPLLPVHAGEIQCRCLGAKVEALDPGGHPLTDEVGELVITEPMPSMPIRLWNDPGDARYRDSYFSTYPGLWRHGDWIKITRRGSCVIYGRSDATLNRGGVRVGTSEFYRAIDTIEEVVDSLVVDTGRLGEEGELVLFVVLDEGIDLDTSLEADIASVISAQLSPRHVPDRIMQIPEIPKTLNGKRLEVPVKKLLLGATLDEVAAPESLSNPGALQVFADLAKSLRER